MATNLHLTNHSQLILKASGKFEGIRRDVRLYATASPTGSRRSVCQHLPPQGEQVSFPLSIIPRPPPQPFSTHWHPNPLAYCRRHCHRHRHRHRHHHHHRHGSRFYRHPRSLSKSSCIHCVISGPKSKPLPCERAGVVVALAASRQTTTRVSNSATGPRSPAGPVRPRRRRDNDDRRGRCRRSGPPAPQPPRRRGRLLVAWGPPAGPGMGGMCPPAPRPSLAGGRS